MLCCATHINLPVAQVFWSYATAKMVPGRPACAHLGMAHRKYVRHEYQNRNGARSVLCATGKFGTRCTKTLPHRGEIRASSPGHIARRRSPFPNPRSTHLHQDHTVGLNAAAGWRHGPLYCSPVTARLLPTRFPGVDASSSAPSPPAPPPPSRSPPPSPGAPSSSTSPPSPPSYLPPERRRSLVDRPCVAPMEALKKQASKLREHVAKQQQVRIPRPNSSNLAPHPSPRGRNFVSAWR